MQARLPTGLELDTFQQSGWIGLTPFRLTGLRPPGLPPLPWLSTFPETNLRTDIGEILKRVTPRTKVVFLANPNNPTGTYISFDEVRSLRAQLPENVLLVLDAAYAEYVKRNDYEAGIELVATTQNTVMTRTFSKIHGLAGLRLGSLPRRIEHDRVETF